MHALLQRQVARHLEGVDVTAAPWAAFLAAVDRSYTDADDDRRLFETAMETSSQELVQANEELRALFHVFPDLILHLDGSGRITACRGRMLRTIPTPRGGLVGHPLRDLLRESERLEFDAALRRTREAGGVATLRHVAEDAASTVHEVRLAAVGEGDAVAIVRDVTDARRHEELRTAKEGAEAASRAKSAFLANMSHELRTPLNAILGYSEMLAEEAPPETRGDLERIHQSGRHLLQVLNAMLDIARIEAGMTRVDVDAIAGHAFVTDALAGVRAAAEAKGLALEARIEPGALSLHSDRPKLHQALRSLLNNAVKFTEHGSIELVAQPWTVDGRAGVRFDVRDTGIGIPAGERSKLFQDFAQIDESATRRFGGAGLGLALCRRLCHLLGGSVTVESEPGVGSTFSLWMPRHLPPAATGRPVATDIGSRPS